MVIARDIHDHPLFGVGLLLRQCFGLVRYLAALDDPLPARPCSVGTHDVRMRTRLRIVVLNIYIGRDKGLPNPVQVGFAIRGTGRLICWELTEGRALSASCNGWSRSSSRLLSAGLGLNYYRCAGD